MTTELDKMLAVKEDRQTIGEFLTWLSVQGLEIAAWNDDDRLLPIYQSKEQLLAEYFGIDLEKVSRNCEIFWANTPRLDWMRRTPMWIKTEQKTNEKQTYNVFDTETGLKYSFTVFLDIDEIIDIRHKSTNYIENVIFRIAIESAYDNVEPLYYSGREAVEFWRQLGQIDDDVFNLDELRTNSNRFIFEGYRLALITARSAQVILENA